MLGKRILAIILLGTIFIVPVLCQAGEFGHACYYCPDSSCDHEFNCISDPCNLLLVPAPHSHQDQVLPSVLPLAEASLDDLFILASDSSVAPPCITSFLEHKKSPPLGSDLPLIC